MLKIVCALLFFLVGCGLGFAKANSYKKRVKELHACEMLFSRLKISLLGAKTPTKELFSELSACESLAVLPFVSETNKRLCHSADFPTIWREEIEKAKPMLALKKEDYSPLSSLCELIGSYDATGIVEGILIATKLLEEKQADASAEYEKNGQLSRSMGMLCGVAAAILII